jgi:uncharacterized protein (DUF885 family)
VLALLSAGLAAACTSGQRTSGAPGDATFTALAQQVLEDSYKRHPSAATDLGVHKYDSQLEDASKSAVAAESQALRDFRAKLAAIDPTTLSAVPQADRQFLIHSMDAGVLALDVIRRWAKDPDSYSGSITNAAYMIMKRSYSPAVDRLRLLIAREKKMPATLAEARKNLDNPPKVYAEIAIDQIDGNIGFFKNDVPAAFTDVKNTALVREFKQANGAVIAALAEYKTFLQRDLLPRSKGDYAYGADTYAKALAANEMIDLPLDELLKIAEADRQKNEDAFQALAKQIDPNRKAEAVLASLQADHPAPDKLLQVTQEVLDSLRQFIVAHHIVTIPPSDPAHVKETPPFARSTTSASMDTPGPFEPAKLARSTT